MGEIKLPASAPKASPGSLGLVRNISSLQVAPSALYGLSRAFPAASGSGRWEGWVLRLNAALLWPFTAVLRLLYYLGFEAS